MKTLLVPATLTSFARKKDGSVKYSFASMSEISNEDFALTDKYYQQNGWLAFKLDEIEAGEIPQENTKVDGQYSPSQTLRRRIFALHMKKGGTKEDFTPYYTRVMAGLEEAIQNQIDAIED